MNKVYMAETLRRLRGNRTQEEVAKACNISISALSSYENGERVPRDEVKKVLADYYKRTVQYIFFKE
jgi:putative transcriptional regulator